MRQYRTILYGLVTAIALLLAACSADDDQTVSSVDAIAFDAQLATDKGMTRTPATAINDETSLQTGGFGVFACYTGLYSYIDSDVHPDFMYNEHVTWNGTNSVWEYFPLKYWPNGEGEVSGQSGVNRHYVSFFAYAPYSNNDSSDPATNPAGYCIPSFSKQGDVGNPWLTYRLHTDVDHQVDLLHAQLLNQTKSDQTVASRLNFTFNHALACVGDQVNISCSNDLKTLIKEKVDTESSITEGSLTLKSVSIKYTLIERGRLIMWNGGEANWQSIASGNRMTTRTVTLTPSAPYELPYVLYHYDGSVKADTPWQDANHGVFYIPLIPEKSSEIQTAEVTVSYDLTYGATTQTISGTSLIPIYAPGSSYAGAYEPGKHLYLNVAIDNVTIYLTAAIAPWTDGETTAINGNEVD